ncbi:MAG: 1-(5-phosphoribosyl)-5-[(5-phosphoribosylamino)methylideneamino]imidazole-4-carboxamide isomerase [Calditrichaeota bacterium]|nr:MAG: 1-(5-phosphoribosyl)-5-[(5-phosphoribosylamino)methylideneamino]imidazole-4-carboxamide isomerase [Calditrichota bacterium]
MRIIPAIDILEGRCVRLHQGRFSRRTDYSDSPVERALALEAQGFRHLHLVDLDGAREGRVRHVNLLAEIARRTSLKVDFGGGLRSRADIQAALEAGASQVNVGSLAVQRPDLLADWIAHFGSHSIIVAADVSGGELRVRGWEEGSGLHWRQFFDRLGEMGVCFLCVTDIARDGTLAGCNLALYQEMRKRFPQFRLIASGGVSTLAELTALETLGVDGVIIGKALQEGRLSPAMLQRWLSGQAPNVEE